MSIFRSRKITPYPEEPFPIIEPEPPEAQIGTTRIRLYTKYIAEDNSVVWLWIEERYVRNIKNKYYGWIQSYCPSVKNVNSDWSTAKHYATQEEAQNAACIYLSTKGQEFILSIGACE